jgi:hypothetical protein
MLTISHLHPVLASRPLTLYLVEIIVAGNAGAVTSVFWNMSASHDETLLFEEARNTGAVIAAAEVVDPIEEQVANELRAHGAGNISCDKWRARGWRHSWLTYTLFPTHHFDA